MKYTLSLIAFLFVSLPTISFAQLKPAGEFAFHLQFVQPLGDLNDQGMEQGFGFNAEYLTAPWVEARTGLSVQVGGKIDFASVGEAETGQTFIDTDGTEYAVILSSFGYGGYGLIRLSRESTHLLQPYIDGLIGGRIFMSTDDVEMIENTCPKYDVEVLSRNITPSWGANLGMLIHFSPEAALDIRASYLQGREIEFIDLSTVQATQTLRTASPSGQYHYETRRARATQLMVQVGLNLALTK